MNLNEDQKKKVAEWVEQGLTVSEIQSKIGTEFGMTMTYMEVRFLIADLGVKPKDKQPEVPAPAPAPSNPGAQPQKMAGPAGGAATPAEPGQEAFSNGVSVRVDQVTRPGALVSGKVTFSDGKTAEWYLDQMGRLGVVPAEQGYKPSQQDIMEFQTELQNELARLGM